MTRRILQDRGPLFRGRALGLLAALALVALLLVSFGVSASGQTPTCTNPATLGTGTSGSAFEIDASANLIVDTPGCIDWLSGGSGTAFRSGVLEKNDKPSGTSDDAFGQGTSENDANPTIVSGSIPPNKSDLKAFGVYTEATPGAKFLELFWSRIQNPSGTTNMDFELNQKFCNPSGNPTNCANNGSGVTPETPVRTTGDKLITYDLANGGTVPTISIRTWSGSAWGNPTVISGGANPGAIGSVNTTQIAQTDTGGLGSQDAYTFGEAAINFNVLFPVGSGCESLGGAYLKSRSSTSFSAEVKDFVSPESISVTNCPAITTSATPSVTIGSGISDTATLSSATSNATGTISFKLYGPEPGSDPTQDTCTAANLVTTLGPVGLGSQNGSGNFVVSSGNYTPQAVGRYEWVASYTSGDSNNTSATSACKDSGEVSLVGKATPTLATSGSGPVIVGAKIHDTATLSGGAGTLGGTLSFQVFAPSDTSCATPIAVTPNVNVSGAGVYSSADYTTSAVGTYRWIAHYSGDASNNPVDGHCNDPGESSTVNKATPTMATSGSGPVIVGQNIHDTATLSGGYAPLGGTISFQVFAPGDTSCSTPIAVNPSATVSGTGSYSSGNYPTSAVGTYRWIAHYSGDANNNAVDGHCNDPGESSTVNKATPTLATSGSGPVIVGANIHDTATLSGGYAPLGGTISFQVFAPGDTTCATPMAVLPNRTVNGAGDYTSADITTSIVGTFRWIAHYSGDANNNAVDGSCNDPGESSAVNKATPTLSTTATVGPVVVGATIHDVAHLTGGYNLGGSITFQVFAPGDTNCQTPITVPPTRTVSGGADYTSGDVTTSAVGTFRWIAHYTGDANNNPVDTSCNDPGESTAVIKATPTLTTTATDSVIVGQNIHDVAHLSGGYAPLGGSITFQVFAPGDSSCATPMALPGVPVSGAADYPSGDITTSMVGTYRWVAHYSGDANNNPVDTSCNDPGESSAVTKATPTLTTTATGPVIVGQGIHDTAHLTGGLAPLGGTITFSVFAPGDSSCATPMVLPAVPVSGAGDYDSPPITTSQTGTYRWIAHYSGDANNNPVDTACNDPGESSAVGKADTTSSTAQSLLPNDSMTLSSAFGNIGGTVDFYLYGPNNPTCDPAGATPAYQQLGVSVSAGSAQTTNSSTFVTTPGTYKWLVVYSGDGNHNGSTSACGVEQFTIDNNAGP
jgi:hypothetical protein